MHGNYLSVCSCSQYVGREDDIGLPPPRRWAIPPDEGLPPPKTKIGTPSIMPPLARPITDVDPLLLRDRGELPERRDRREDLELPWAARDEYGMRGGKGFLLWKRPRENNLGFGHGWSTSFC